MAEQRPTRPQILHRRPRPPPRPRRPRGILDYLHFNPPTSPYSAFVADALDNDPSLITQEAPQHDHRVYVRPTPWSTTYQTYR